MYSVERHRGFSLNVSRETLDYSSFVNYKQFY